MPGRPHSEPDSLCPHAPRPLPRQGALNEGAASLGLGPRVPQPRPLLPAADPRQRRALPSHTVGSATAVGKMPLGPFLIKTNEG